MHAARKNDTQEKGVKPIYENEKKCSEVGTPFPKNKK